MTGSGKGYILQIQRFSVNDGEGIRTVIFLPGCPLRCQWCSNPETWTPEPKLAFYAHKCINCQTCRMVCPNDIFPPGDSRTGGNCNACGICVTTCPQEALTLLNREMTTGSVIDKIERDAIFFRTSGGGVTFSGGEPTFQTAFLRNIAHKLYDYGISMAIETCGIFQWEAAKDIFSLMDQVFIDIKHMDPVIHKRVTGLPNGLVLDNARSIHTLRIPMTVRIPLIPQLNATRQNLHATALFMKQHLPGATIELLPHHTLGHEKYRALGLHDLIHDEFGIPDEQLVAESEMLFEEQGVTVVRYK